MTTTVVEMVTFKLKAGVEEAQWLESASQLESFLLEQPGFYYRSLSKGNDDTWYDIVYWQDMATAEALSAQFMSLEAAQQMCALIDMDTVVKQDMPVRVEMMMCQQES